MDSLRLYFKLIRIAFQARMQYRADFFTGIIGVITLNVVNLGLIGILVSRFNNLNGWTLWEMVFLYCLWILGHSIYSLFFWHIRALEDYLIQGTFDQFLLRPANPFILFIGREVQYLGLADATFGIAGFVLAYTNLGLHWDWVKWVFFGLAIVSGTLLETTINLLVACVAFWTGRSRRVGGLIMQLNSMIQHYPMDIFGTTFRVVVTGLIPVAFMNYYPALMLLDKTDRLGGWGWLSYMSPIVAILMVYLSARLWNFALQRYSSSGG
ncbi:MAG: ABC-2 family transporter protein [Chloroflexi bacterium]|nr:ABC-2 family transporter protein [Chloroflexota bacterium]